jgi:hypothetical protein
MIFVFICHGVKLARFLISHGLECKKVELDKVNPDYLIYKFEKTNEIDKLMGIWQSNR